MKRDYNQRIAYALRRMTLAVDRLIRSSAEAEKLQAVRWVNAWKRAVDQRRSR